MPILTIDSARLNGTPSAGTVRITASRSPLMDSGNNTVYSGTQTFPLNAQGKLSVSLPATDSPSIGPFTYTVEANLASGQWIYRGVKLPANVATIDITDAQSASQQTYPTRQEWDAITAGMNTTIAGKVTGPGLTLRRDTSVGERVFLDRPGGSTMLYGDTGWRDISSLINPASIGPFTGGLASYAEMRREGDLVTVRVSGSLLTTTTAVTNTTQIIPEIPVGYRSDKYVSMGVAVALGKLISVGNYTTVFSLDLRGIFNEGDAVRFTARWHTTNAWPTTLPGEPTI